MAQEEYETFLRALAPVLDLDWRKYRRKMARRAVYARAAKLGFADLGAYGEYVRANAGEARALPDRMRITVTRFLRERERWNALFAGVVPGLVQGRERLRVWSAGCCSGEEPYGFALLWLHTMANHFADTRVEILATDIDANVLRRAEAAVYPEGTLREVPSELRARWFGPRDAGGRRALSSQIRDLVRFSRHNLMEDASPRDVDLILCRYLVFTYYRGTRRRQAAERLHEALRTGGALMLGRKEGLAQGDEELFEPWPGVPGVFRRKEDFNASVGTRSTEWNDGGGDERESPGCS